MFVLMVLDMSVLERLVGESSLTARQFELLTSYVRVASGEVRLKDAVSSAPRESKRKKRERPLTMGSYSRTVAQARKNIRKSLVTIVVGLWLGAIKVEEVRRLFELVGDGAHEISDEQSDRFVQLLEVLLDRIVV